MALRRKFKESITVVTLSLILLVAVSNSLPNILTPAYAKFAGVGDWGCSTNTKNTVNNIVNHGAYRTLSLGDNSYQDTATCWFNIIKPIDGDANPSTSNKLKITIGNHDDTSTSLLNSYKSHFHLSKLYYSFDIDSVHVLIMNSEDPNRSNKDSDQYKFVKSDLETAHSNPGIKWIIAEVHQPFFSSPNGCSASSCKGSKSFTETYQPLFDQNRTKVDLVLFGHVHNYQRTAPLIFNSADPLKPTKTTLERCDYTNPTGTIYAIVGTGGINFHSLNAATKASFVMVQQASRFGQLDISFNSDYSKLTGKFFSNEPGTAGKCLQSTTVLDQFAITKTFAVLQTANPFG
jgi:Calcineurin-like phosphoesterase